MGHAFGFFPSGVCKRFPEDVDLQALKPEGYAASTLTDEMPNRNIAIAEGTS